MSNHDKQLEITGIRSKYKLRFVLDKYKLHFVLDCTYKIVKLIPECNSHKLLWCALEVYCVYCLQFLMTLISDIPQNSWRIWLSHPVDYIAVIHTVLYMHASSRVIVTHSFVLWRIINTTHTHAKACYNILCLLDRASLWYLKNTEPTR